MLSATLLIVAIVVIVALVFDFTNGFHDAANAMATSVATGALTPRRAVALAAVLNVVGAFLSTEVAKTISGGMVDDSFVTPEMVLAGLCGAILWNLLTWLLGLPSSSSHALFGGLIGAVLVGAGASGVHWPVIVSKILLPAVVAPVVAGLAAALATRAAYRVMRGADREGGARMFRAGQTVSASFVALAHGTSDGQKTMGVITLVLVTGGYQASGTGPHLWVIVAAGLAIGLGTYSGGWRIMRTMGKGLVEIQSPQGFAAETSSSVAILASSHMGFGLSTTHVASGSILGSGLGRGTEVRWGTARRMAYAWALTLPAAGAVGALAALLTRLGTGGSLLVVVILAVFSAIIWRVSRRAAVSHANVNEQSDVVVLARPGADSVADLPEPETATSRR
ncbi:PiT family inorganic phosphate transporter [Barrientosiimonas humi]|uniref:Phosphate transporter n=2 Tax=Barrientosiimonas TaxID=1535207 RepID=A0A542X9A6_9MICO|nr:MULTISPECIES: inorganic phosphate transporter [Barrientosiimonas]TQL32421.1 PiT family inorganic phosphate transporter [Barrientosiimonas humi]BDZ57178.1 phosphate transporter [Barrientosiimonas endolithica]CAG7572412.1 Low-affinity inorganic phosphate transporter 1 [Barrientosiimonas humi]